MFKIDNLPKGKSNQLALTNKVYLNPRANFSQTNLNTISDKNTNIYIKIQSCIFLVEFIEEACSLENPSNIQVLCVNKIHREFLSLSLRNELSIHFYTIGDLHLKNISFLSIGLDSYTKTSGQISVDYGQIIDYISEKFRGQIFKIGQVLIILINSNYIKVSILDLGLSIAGDPGLFDPQVEIDWQLNKGETRSITIQNCPVGKEGAKTDLFRENLKSLNYLDLGIGGLSVEFNKIFSRAFKSRVLPPSVFEKMGLSHVKGLMLYGPPGTGKTLIARKIAEFLNSNEPKIVNGPEILDKYVGGSEKNIRALFEDAEKDEKEYGDESKLHIIILDEIDAICKSRGSTSDSTGVHDSVVNQLLSKIDGVNALNNVLLIGMTNRLDLLDEALLRPGRFEVQVEVSLPDYNGRIEILKIHTKSLVQNDMLEKDVDYEQIATLAENYSGAEISGLVRLAASRSYDEFIDLDELARNRGKSTKSTDWSKLKIRHEDFICALKEITPAFGKQDSVLSDLGGYTGDLDLSVADFSSNFKSIISSLSMWSNLSSPSNISTVLLYGDSSGIGASTLCQYTLSTVFKNFPFRQVISPSTMTNSMSTISKLSEINSIFTKSFKSDHSIIIIDKIDELCDYSEIGPTWNMNILNGIRSNCRKTHPYPHKKLIVLITCTSDNFVNNFGLKKFSSNSIKLPLVSGARQIEICLKFAINRKSASPGEISDRFSEISNFLTDSKIISKYLCYRDWPVKVLMDLVDQFICLIDTSVGMSLSDALSIVVNGLAY